MSIDPTSFHPLWPEYLFIFLFGSAMGSFLNVVIYRVPRGESLVSPGSHCPKCNRPIRPWENIPLLSFLFLRGRCAGCKTAISWQYPAVEAVTGGLFALLLWHSGFSVSLALHDSAQASAALARLIPLLVLTGFLIALSIIDIQTYRLPNVLTLSGAIAGAALGMIFNPRDWWIMLLGAGVGLGLLMFMGLVGKVLFRKESLGMGDVKLAGMIGLYLGPAFTAGMYVFAIFLAAIVGLTLIVIGGRSWGSKIPFGPYLAGGAIISVIWGAPILQWYINLAFRR